jgi:tRNA pseudouridine38-40 synthase
VVSRLVLEYDGTEFAGWATQPGQRTVCGVVSDALSVLLRSASPVSLSVAGRTDAGVHAWRQVASYLGPVVPLAGLNALLPSDVVALSCSAAPDGFDARFDATSRAYCYRVLARRERSAFCRGRALWWPHPVDVAALSECASALAGVHDFTAFTPSQTHHVRFSREVFGASWQAWPADPELLGGTQAASRGELLGGTQAASRGELLEFRIEADAFMRHMNRVLVGTMLEVAGGRRSVASFRDLLRGRPRAEAGPTALACGLYLAGVGYGGERVLGCDGQLRVET